MRDFIFKGEKKVTIEKEVEKIITDSVSGLSRPDLFRAPIVAFSSAYDKKYLELKALIGEWHLLPFELLSSAKSVISYFVPFTKEVVYEPQTLEHGSFLWSEAYQEINRHFDTVNEAIARLLASKGYESQTIKATHTYSQEDLKSMWSHRSAAVIAGLGTFGINKLVITEKGSGGRFCTVITSALLEVNEEPVESQCLYIKSRACGLCLKTCPVGAISVDGIDKFVCQDELNKNQELMRAETGLWMADTCGKCVSACPLGYLG